MNKQEAKDQQYVIKACGELVCSGRVGKFRSMFYLTGVTPEQWSKLNQVNIIEEVSRTEKIMTVQTDSVSHQIYNLCSNQQFMLVTLKEIFNLTNLHYDAIILWKNIDIKTK